VQRMHAYANIHAFKHIKKVKLFLNPEVPGSIPGPTIFSEK
jgi:hypothetical protein